MRRNSHRALLALSILASACGMSADASTEGGRVVAESTPDALGMLPTIELEHAPGVEPGTPILALGIRVGEVEWAAVDGRSVVLRSKLIAGQSPEFTANTCARIVPPRQHGDPSAVELDMGDGEIAKLVSIPACPSPPQVDPAPEPEPEPEPEAEPEPTPQAPSAKGKSKGGQKQKRATSKRCGDDLSFATLSVKQVSPQMLHLPDGGWRAKIQFKNEGNRFIEIDPVGRAAFMDEAGQSLAVATLPASGDWFMPFEVPPHSTKVVTVTFHDDGAGKPWVRTMKYAFSCL